MQPSQLNMLLQNSNFISQALQTLKKKFNEQDHFGHQSESKLRPDESTQEIQRAISLREAFRSQAEGLEANRSLVRLKKEQIEKSKVFLEGLQYYKNTLKSKIKECQIPTPDLTDYLKQPFKVQNWGQDFELTQNHLEKELEEMKTDKQNYQRLISKRNGIIQESKKLNKLCNQDFPSSAQRLRDIVEQTSKAFGMPPQQQIVHIISRNLSKIFDVLSPLKEIQNIEVRFEEGNELYECFEVEIKANPQSRLYKIANNYKVVLQAKGIKILFATMKNDENVLVGVDRSSDFTNEQIFHRLVANQPLKSVYGNPTIEFERNINNKFGFLKWVQKLLCSSAMSGTKLIEIIRERMFCIQITKYLIENIKKMPYFILLSKPGEGSSPNFKKISFTNIDKITFQQYQKLIVIPQWVLKKLNNIEIAEQGQLNMSEKLEIGQQKNNLNEMLQKLGIEQLNNGKLNNYYKAKMVCGQQSIALVFIVPYAIPETPSKIKLISHQRTQSVNKNGSKPNQSQQKYYRQSEKPTGIGAQLIKIQRQINQGIIQFVKGKQFEPFRLFLQINRLVFKLWSWSERVNEKQLLSQLNQKLDY